MAHHVPPHVDMTSRPLRCWKRHLLQFQKLLTSVQWKVSGLGGYIRLREEWSKSKQNNSSWRDSFWSQPESLLHLKDSNSSECLHLSHGWVTSISEVFETRSAGRGRGEGHHRGFQIGYSVHTQIQTYLATWRMCLLLCPLSTAAFVDAEIRSSLPTPSRKMFCFIVAWVSIIISKSLFG